MRGGRGVCVGEGTGVGEGAGVGDGAAVGVLVGLEGAAVGVDDLIGARAALAVGVAEPTATGVQVGAGDGVEVAALVQATRMTVALMHRMTCLTTMRRSFLSSTPSRGIARASLPGPYPKVVKHSHRVGVGDEAHSPRSPEGHIGCLEYLLVLEPDRDLAFYRQAASKAH